jgi:hypothetical protein
MSFVTGIGGIFFKSRNPSDLARWYRDVLGVPADADSASWAFPWQDQHGEPGYTVWGVFRSSTSYFGNSGQTFMINFRVTTWTARSSGFATPAFKSMIALRKRWRAGLAGSSIPTAGGWSCGSPLRSTRC